MPLLFALSEVVWDNLQDLLKTVFSAGSLVITLYFWFVRSNRERVSLKGRLVFMGHSSRICLARIFRVDRLLVFVSEQTTL